MFSFYLLISLNFICLTFAAKSADLITSLPGLSNFPSFKQYSGYLDATSTKHLHYWFVESQNNPATDPVVLWLNGGPGCSSLDGLLSENGPLHVNNDGETLYANPYSWNKIANVLYLESPAGVGYSYDDNNDVKTSDDEVSQHNYNALVDFFKKFPEFVKNPFFVSGESYGGIYLPTLSVRIMQGSFHINFKGMAVGNGMSSFSLNDESLVFFAYYHGLFGKVLWDRLGVDCCNGTITRENCKFGNPVGDCADDVAEVFQYVYNCGLNEYALYLDCASNIDIGNGKRYKFDMSNVFRSLKPKLRANVLSQKIMTKPTSRLGVVPPCINATAQTNYLNKASVRQALHIKEGLPTWAVCSDAVGASYQRLYDDMYSQYHQLLKHPNFRILVYNGDTDMACNFLGDQWFVDGLKLTSTMSHRPWYVEGQVAGFAQQFGNLTYTTIRGAGHMVPQWAPSYAYSMFEKFVLDKPFTN
uniref:lysosomal protective protein n=1 Tax=Ciona intestinalis TaxID=7719 RepID=UPI0000522D4A|nr:lysosomal protective protein [Ciona intestinalis]|eukprot:XP_002130105.1 lysosomal protective protein [Ciona intestinalis]